MAAGTPPGAPGQSKHSLSDSGAVPFDISQPPVIEGFRPSERPKDEGFKEKFIRKSKENPFVPIGCLGTVGMLMFGLRAFHQGKTRQSQLLMRGRILAQGFTVIAIIAGVFVSAYKAKQ
ncbi:HIG1 domain family member 2A, mitochondrial [Austrofundulus limnaeus]|uniref:HIG1 domain family member 2A, mitochondrial n=1 Tax=Austrofundulus limnaeus TaxID=52670 RepID=A0A2I4B1F7_AUSLI|nr:PREDICTED: HIG1 domain family member 2A, mitochondrial [Austrofundulus limnaeus]